MFSIPEKHIDQLISLCNYDPYYSLVEECGELISAVAKHCNQYAIHDYSKEEEHIIEEMTHVLVSMNLVCRELDITEDDIMRHVKAKAIVNGFESGGYDA